ncbi:MAG: MFS transporter [Oscillospiraceae bacterium]|nr:MFS transporter [Oscillospiraceae bacterium]
MENERRNRLWTRTFSTVVVSHLIFYFGFYMLAPTLPLYIKAQGGTSAHIGLVSTGFCIGCIIMRFLVPFLQERYSRKILMRIGILISLAMAALYAAVSSIAGIIFLRFMQGIGVGMVTAFAGAIAADSAPDSRQGEGIGFFGMGTTAAVALSPTLGLVVMNKLGFTALFICSALVLALSAVGWSTIEIPKPRRRAADAPRESIWNKIYDTKILFQTVLLLLYGVARGTQQSFLTVMATEEGLSMITIYSVFETVSSFLLRFVTRKSFDKYGPGPTMITGGAASVTAFFLFSVVRSNAVLLIAAVCNGIAMGALVPTFQVWIMDTLGPERRTLGNSLYFNICDIGTAVGAGVMGVVAGLTNYHGVFRIVMFVMIAYLAIYFIVSAARRKRAAD